MAGKRSGTVRSPASMYASAILAGGLGDEDVEAHGMITEHEFTNLIAIFNDLAYSLTPAQRQVLVAIVEAAAEGHH